MSPINDEDFGKAVRKALNDKRVPVGKEVEIVKIFVTNKSNNPIHEYRIVLGPPQ
jgi:hypothetical protein